LRTVTKCAWLVGVYLASGAPYGIVNKAARVYLARLGTGPEEIGRITGWALLAYALKFLWAPLLDRVGRRQHWAAGCQMAVALLLFVLAGSGPSALGLLLIALAACSATLDVAADAYSIEMLEPRELGIANGIRVTAYKGGYLLTAGLLVGLADGWGWPGVFRAAGFAMGALSIVTLLLPRVPKGTATGLPLVEPLRRFIARDGLLSFVAVALFILLFKIGDFAMAPMIEPFLVKRGLTNAQIGYFQTTAGVIATVLGAMSGGALTTRWGIFRALWILGLFQALSNLGYAAAAATDSPTLLWSAVVFEPFCGGLGTAAFLAFLMACCGRSHTGTGYALLSALFGLAGSLAAFPSGEWVRAWGYGPYFAFTTLLAAPAFALLPWVRRWTPPEPRVSDPLVRGANPPDPLD